MTGPLFVLIPGAGGMAIYWARVVDELTRRGFEAVAVELPADDDTLGLDDYAKLVVAVAADRDAVVLVAQSMGSFTAALACELRPVHGLVFVNAMIPRPRETAGQWWETTGQSAARRANDLRDGRDPDAPFDPMVTFLHDIPDDIVQEVMAAGDREQSGTAFGSPFDATAWQQVPLLVIAAESDRLFPLDFQQRLTRDRLGLEPQVMPGGHLSALDHAADLAARLITFAESLPARG